MLDLCAHLGWSFEADFWLRDHRGHRWHLLYTPWAEVEELLWEAWACLVSLQFRRRKTASDLQDLDPWLHKAFAASLNALDRARLSALHSGCFVDAAQHGRYDASQDRHCHACGVLDLVDHWFCCPRFSSLKGELEADGDDSRQWPACFRNHLLVSRDPLVDELENYFLQLDPRVNDF